MYVSLYVLFVLYNKYLEYAFKNFDYPYNKRVSIYLNT